MTYVGYFILCVMSIVYDGLGEIDICDSHDGLNDSNVLNVYDVHDYPVPIYLDNCDVCAVRDARCPGLLLVTKEEQTYQPFSPQPYFRIRQSI